MQITRLKLKNWRNFRQLDVSLRERVYIIGPNAAGKSNLLDAIRFLRDVAKPGSGGLQKAVESRGRLTKVRSLFARKDPEVEIQVTLAESADSPPLWQYTLAFRNEAKGSNRTIVSREEVINLATKEKVLDTQRDKVTDVQRLTQTALEQVNANEKFRAIADFFAGTTYLHLVPQLLKHQEQLGGYRMEHDPFGQSFLERIAKTPEKTRKSRLGKIEQALKVCVPNMEDLKFERDEATGHPHLNALFKHWRPDAGRQREDQFSDGTLRLLGIMWSLFEGDSLLMLEEPELSLSEGIVKDIHPLLCQLQKAAKYRRQIVVTTHSQALLSATGMDPREIIRLEVTDDGTQSAVLSDEDKTMLQSGHTVAEVLLPKARPGARNVRHRTFPLFEP